MSGEEYTPTTDQVRNAYGWSPHDNFQTATRRAAEAAFDRWLAARDRENRAIGWDEGYTSGSYEAREDRVFYVNGPGKSTNPYRGDNR